MKLNRDVLTAKLALLQDAIARVEAKRPDSLDTLLVDRDRQDILAKNLERAVQLSVDIAAHVAAMNGLLPQNAGDTFRLLAERGMLPSDIASAMVRAVGFRNVSIHDYVSVDWRIVMAITADGLTDLKSFGRWTTGLLADASR